MPRPAVSVPVFFFDGRPDWADAWISSVCLSGADMVQ